MQVSEAAVRSRTGFLRANLANPTSLWLLFLLVVVQVADLVTTYVGIVYRGLVEENPLFRSLFSFSPYAGAFAKLLAVMSIVLIVLMRLQGRRAHSALLLALCLSALAPLLNAYTLTH